ncbi:TPA: hypothetical protein ACH3X1_009203 [Trebouxia sp. C0004]
MTDNALSLGIARQDGAEQRAISQQLAPSVADIVTSKISGPTDAQGVAHALRNPASRREAVQLHGAQ